MSFFQKGKIRINLKINIKIRYKKKCKYFFDIRVSDDYPWQMAMTTDRRKHGPGGYRR